MKSILFYGNCQTYAIYKTLSLPDNYIQKNVECFSTEIKENDFLNLIKNSDVIITQPINENYRGKKYLSTKFIIDNKSKNCIIIFFDSCYFNFYYPDLTYKTIDNELLKHPNHYHYNKLIEYYNKKKNINEYIDEVINNENLYDSTYLEKLANDSLNELENRYLKMSNDFSGNNIFFITTHDFIKNNYKKQLLFYSMNHPTKHLIQFICVKIIEMLNLNHNINEDIELLNNTKCILYKSIQNDVDFNITKCECLTNNLSNKYDIVKLYFDTYKTLPQDKIIP